MVTKSDTQVQEAVDLLTSLLRDVPDDQYLNIRAISPQGVAENRFYQLSNLRQNGFEPCLPTNDGGKNYYFGICPRFEKNGTKKGVNMAVAIWFDEWRQGDRKDFPQLSWWLETSPGKFQGGYFLDKPCTDTKGVESLVKRLVTAIGGDKGVWDASRVLRIPGYLNVKPEHPDHPRAALLELNPDLRYSIEELEKAIPTIQKPKTVGKEKDQESEGSVLRSTEYGNRDTGLRDVIWKAINKWNMTDRADLFELGDMWNKRLPEPYGTRDGDSDPNEWIHDKITRALAKVSGEDVPAFFDAEDITPRESEWLWPDYFEFGEVVSIVGDYGLGKTMMTQGVGVTGACEGRFPTGENASHFKSWFISFEDDPEKSTHKRLTALGYNWNGSVKITDALMEPERVNSLEKIERGIREGEIKFLAIDPVTNLMSLWKAGDKNQGRDAIPFIMSLMKLARRTGCCIVIVMHMNKNEAQSAIYRGSGALEWMSKPRCAFLLGRDPDDKTKTYISNAKANNSAQPETIAYTIRGDENKNPVFAWCAGTFDLSPDELTNKTLANDRAGAVVVLQEFVGDDGRTPAKEVIDEATERGINYRTLTRAKKDEGYRHKKMGDGHYDWIGKDHTT